MTDSYHSEIIGNNTTKDRFKRAEFSHQLLGLTNIGLSRSKNQDALSFFFKAPNRFIFAVADGLGCYMHSEKSALKAVSEIAPALFNSVSLSDICQKLHKEFIAAYPYEKRGIRGRFRQYLQRKTTIENVPTKTSADCGSTTSVVADIDGDQLTLGNIGDSRGYVFRDGQAIYQTKDQSLASLLEHYKKNEPDRIFAAKNLKGAILNSLGSPEVAFEFPTEDGQLAQYQAATPLTQSLSLIKGDIVLLATDGVFNNITDAELGQLLAATPWDELCELLEKTILRVMRMGWTNLGEKASPDNFSFVIYRHW